jgi:hypothetical protein
MSFCSGCIDLKEIPGSPSGKTEKIAGLDAYVAPGSKKGTIVRGGKGCTRLPQQSADALTPYS